MTKKASLTPEQKRARDLRRALLLVHVVLEWLVVIASQCDWWSVHYEGQLWGHVKGSDPQAFQSRYIALAAVVSFFFTSYDLVADADIQWPPLLASAFALGCAGQVTYQLVYREETLATVTDALARVEIEQQKKKALAQTAAVGSGVAASGSGTAAVATATSPEVPAGEQGIRLRIRWGLDLVLFGSFAMTVLSAWLTFFAKREEDE